MKIYDGDKSESPRMKIHGGDITERRGGALNKRTIGGCPKQDDGKGMP